MDYLKQKYQKKTGKTGETESGNQEERDGSLFTSMHILAFVFNPFYLSSFIHSVNH
jgi:hypothetical protein